MRCRNMFAIRHGEKLMKQIAKQDEKLSDLKGLTLSSASTPSLMDITRNLQVLQTRCGNSKYSQFCKCSLTRMIKGINHIITSFTQFSRKSNKNAHTMNFWGINHCMYVISKPRCSSQGWEPFFAAFVVAGWTGQNNTGEEHVNRTSRTWQAKVWNGLNIGIENPINQRVQHTKINAVVDLFWCYALVLNRPIINFGQRGPSRAY